MSSAYFINYCNVMPMIEVIDYVHRDVKFDSLSYADELLKMMTDPMGWTEAKTDFIDYAADTVLWVIGIITHQINKILKLGIPLQTKKIINLILYDTAELCLIVTE
jgi:hypothetical protein